MSEGVVSNGVPAGTGAGDVKVESSGWMSGLAPEDVSYVETKGWTKAEKPIEAILKSYRNAESLRGVPVDQLARIPNWDNGDEVGAFFKQIGVPESPDGYQVAEPLKFSGGELDAKVVNSLAHAAKLTPVQHKEFTKAVTDYFETVHQETQTQRATAAEAEKQEVERSWGKLKEENYLAARKAAERFGITAEDLQAMEGSFGFKKSVELLVRIGRAFGEHRPGAEASESAAAPYGMTAQAAQSRIQSLQKDTGFYAKLKAGDSAARKEWDNLHQIAFGS